MLHFPSSSQIPSTSLSTLLHVFCLSKTSNIKQQNIQIKQDKKCQKKIKKSVPEQTKHGVHFVVVFVGQLLMAMRFAISVVDIPSKTQLVKTDFPFLSMYQV